MKLEPVSGKQRATIVGIFSSHEILNMFDKFTTICEHSKAPPPGMGEGSVEWGRDQPGRMLRLSSERQALNTSRTFLSVRYIFQLLSFAE